MGTGSSKARSGGGGGGAAKYTIPSGGGIQINISGKQRTYFKDANGTLRDMQNPSNTIPKSVSVKNLIDNMGGKVISKSNMQKRKREREIDRKNTPDYELMNPFHKRGMGKTVYRPRRSR